MLMVSITCAVAGVVLVLGMLVTLMVLMTLVLKLFWQIYLHPVASRSPVAVAMLRLLWMVLSVHAVVVVRR